MYNIDLYREYVGCKRAYNKVNKVQLYRTMQGFGTPEKQIRLIKMTTENTTEIKIDGELSEQLRIGRIRRNKKYYFLFLYLEKRYDNNKAVQFLIETANI